MKKVKKHLKEDMKMWKKIESIAKREYLDDKKLLSSLKKKKK